MHDHESGSSPTQRSSIETSQDESISHAKFDSQTTESIKLVGRLLIEFQNKI
jgi:hypothetical protein